MKKLSIILLTFLLAGTPVLAAKESENTDKGYMGTLPDITKSFQTTEPAVSTPIFDRTEKFNSANEIKPAPRDNPSFVNIILKTDKTSPYINDINEVITMLDKIYDSIEKKENIQIFVAKVYFFNKNVDYLRDKYAGKPESQYISFRKLSEVSLHAKSVSTLRAEAERYNPYLAYTGTGYIYNTNNIDEQLNYLKTEIEQTIAILKEAE